MALFKKDEKKVEAKSQVTDSKTVSKKTDAPDSVKNSKASKAQITGSAVARLSDIIISPRITEKTVQMMDKGIYTFNVRKDANKTEVKKAIKQIYKVEPLAVKIVNYPAKTKFDYRSGNKGKKKGGKKAIVHLKEGDKISII